jgi:guanine nucleotide-binding protein G(I)/G(S)/G(T) subunit beta-1
LIQKIASLHSQIKQAQASKSDTTLGQVVTNQLSTTGTKLSTIKTPPTIKLRRTLKGHFGKVTAFQWSGDSKQLVSAGQDGNLLIWNTVTNNKIQSIALNSSYVMSVGMEQTKGNLVACGGLDNLCTIYPRNTPEKAVEMVNHEGFVSCCRFIDASEILTSSGDSTCIRWDIASGRPISTLAEHRADALSLSLQDRNVFASCSVDKTVKVWDLRTPDQAVQSYVGYHTADVNDVEFMTTDTNCFATCCQDNIVRLFDMRAYNQLSSYATGAASGASMSIPDDGLTSLSMSRSGRVIFTGHVDGTVYAFDVLSTPKKAGQKHCSPAFTLPQAHERHVTCVGVSPSGEALCTSSWDGMLKIWA